MADMDQGIKRLIQTHPADVLALALPGAKHLGMLTTDIAAEPQLMLDTLQRIRYQGVECAANIEAEARPRPDMPRRCFEYGARKHHSWAASHFHRSLARAGRISTIITV